MRPAPTSVLGLRARRARRADLGWRRRHRRRRVDRALHSLSARRLVGTDIVHAIPLTFLAGASHFGMGNVDLKILGFLLIGSVPGIALGSRITGLVPDWVLRVALALVLFWAASR